MATRMHYHILKATEGGKGQKQALIQLKAAGLKARPMTSCYVGLTAVEVEGNKRDHVKASRILFGRS